jgi:hypothetical protein
MGAVVASLISGLISIGTNYWNKVDEEQATRVAAAESANDAVRSYNETGRQKESSTSLFNTNISTTYGSDFLSKLKSGADTTTLINSLAQGDTAFSKQLQEYEAEAQQAVSNSVTTNQETGLLASMQGQENSTSVLSQAISNEQSSGDAIASQNTSGIRSDKGTGSNTQKIQEQANELAMESLQESIATENQTTLSEMESTQVSAAQTAAELRSQADISAESALESVLSDYASYQAEQEDYQASMDAYKADYDYYEGIASEDVNWFDETFFGAESTADDIDEKFDTFEDDDF